ncbi:hypothetical protein EHM69_05580 [candidate division KSB1 bacterium]|nr:MAG: hypothetical protein EHM69_05580 [candidate division KSB1 bacterium]
MTAEGKNKSLADVLREKQIIGEEQLSEALQYSREHSVPLDHALVELNVLSEDDLRMILGEVFQIRSLKLEDVEIDRDAVRHIPAHIAHRHHLIPVRRSGSTLAVAMADPTDAAAHAALRAVTDFDVIPFIARYDAIEHAVFLHYGEPVANDAGAAETMDSAVSTHSRNMIDDDRVGHVGRSILLNHNQTFETFVEDTANQFPLSIARAVAGLSSEEEYSPFHCWGIAGCGKTHLLHAITNYVNSHSPMKRTILTSGQRFVDNLFECVRDKKINFFRYLYRELDILLVDDAEPLIARDWAQREILETIQHLRRNKRFVVLSARRNLAADPRTTPELRIVLESGVIAPFSGYSRESMYEIARRWAGRADLQPDILSLLVESCEQDLNNLRNILQQVTVMAMLGEKEVTAESVCDLIRLCGIGSAENSADRARLLATVLRPNMLEDKASAGSAADNTLSPDMKK